MRVTIIPLNSDNYGYLLVDDKTQICAIVDVSGQPDKVLEVVRELNVHVVMVLTTHKHWDHAGGNEKVKRCLPHVKVYGSKYDNVEACTDFVVDGQELLLGDIKVMCILTPGHTMGHMSYYCVDETDKVVFTGDCLFVGGAGKFFEGTGDDMYTALYDKLGRLPPETKVYCGHEYTLSNYKFALSCEPSNGHLVEANEQAVELRRQNLPTIPSTIAKEFQTNPFLRVMLPTIQALFPDQRDGASILSAIREAKNTF